MVRAGDALIEFLLVCFILFGNCQTDIPITGAYRVLSAESLGSVIFHFSFVNVEASKH